MYNFRFWGFITRKIAGLVLPDRGNELADDEADDAAINLLVESSLVDLVYDGHKVRVAEEVLDLFLRILYLTCLGFSYSCTLCK